VGPGHSQSYVACRGSEARSPDAAHDLRDLRVPPGNRLEGLKGKWAGHYSMRVNDQYRLVFRWTDGNAHDVLITDYHS